MQPTQATTEDVAANMSIDTKQSREELIRELQEVKHKARELENLQAECQHAQQEIRQRNRELLLLNRASQALNSSLDLDQVLSTVLEEVRHLLGVVASSIWLLTSSRDELVCRQASGPQSETVRGWRLSPAQGLVGWVARTGQSLIVPDVKKDTRHFEKVDQQTGLGIRSVLSVPLKVSQTVIGVLQVVDSAINRFDLKDRILMESLAATAAVAIENARLWSKERARATTLAQALEQTRELDRLKGEFIQNVSHELRTPLTIARGYAELLESGELGELLPEQREAVHITAQRMRMLSGIVEDLTAALEAKQDALQQTPIDLAALIQTRLAYFQAEAEQAQLDLQVELFPDLPLAWGNAPQLRRVLDSLMDNAFKFTPPGGRVTVRLRPGESANPNGGPAASQDLVLEVSDTGIGIPADQQERIFEQFYQIDGSMTRRYGGTGLGLALVKGIVEGHGGQVGVQSQPDAGSTFWVSLPIWTGEED